MNYSISAIAGGSAALVGLALLFSGCANMPGSSPDADNQCSFSTGTYALAGGGLAAGITALATNGNGLDTGAAALVGGAIGAAYGNSIDQQCRQKALQNAMAQAEAYQAQQDAYQQQLAQREQEADAAPAPTVTHYRHKIYHPAAPAPAPAPPPPPDFQPAVWKSASSGNSGAVTPLAPISVDPNTGKSCDTVSNAVTTNGQTTNQQETVCKQADGTWQPATSG